MHRGILILIACVAALASAASAAEVRRPMVGFLPFHGPSATYRHAIPYFVYWQFCHISGVGRTDMNPMVSCVELDRLTVPRRLDDTASYSRLAAATGVDYLVTGEVRRQTRTRLRFRVAVYSSTDPRFAREQDYECALGDLIGKAAPAARAIAAAVGVGAAETKFDAAKVSPAALRLLDDSVRLGIGCERDRAQMGESFRLAERARNLCPGSPLAVQWGQSFYFEAPRNLGGYREFRLRSMRSLSLHGDTVRSSQSNATAAPTPTAAQRLTFDRNYPSTPIGPGGKPILSRAWRNNLGNYRFRTRDTAASARDTKAYLSVLDALMTRYPRSAYIRYSSAVYYARVGEFDDYTSACEKAVAINPESYRLQMELIRAHLGSFKNDKALEVLKAASGRWPDRTECHYFAAALYRRWKQYDKAVDETLTVQRLDPKSDGVHDLLAEDYLRSGKVVEALREVADSDPGLRRGMIMFSVVLSGIFVVVAMGIAVLAHFALKPERRHAADTSP